MRQRTWAIWVLQLERNGLKAAAGWAPERVAKIDEWYADNLASIEVNFSRACEELDSQFPD